MTSTEDHGAGASVPAVAPARHAPVWLRRRVWPALRAILAVLVLVMLVKWVGHEVVLARFAAFPLPMTLACVLLSLLVQTLGAIRLGLLSRSQGLSISTAAALGINLAAVFYGLVLPGGNATGWVVRLSRIAGSPRGAATAVQVLAGDRALSTAAGAFIGMIADTLLGRPALVAVSVTFVGITVAAGGLAWVLLTPNSDRLVAKIRDLPILARFASKTRAHIRPMARREPFSIVVWLGLSLAVHLTGIVIWVWIGWALGVEVDILTMAWVRSAAMIVGLMPLTIAGLGLREGTVVYLLTNMGVSGADALTLSLLAFAVTVLAMGILGGVGEAVRLAVPRPISTD